MLHQVLCETPHRKRNGYNAVSIMSEVSVRGRVESGQLVAIPIRSSHNLMRCIEIQVMAGRRLPDVAQKFIELLIAELERAV